MKNRTLLTCLFCTSAIVLLIGPSHLHELRALPQQLQKILPFTAEPAQAVSPGFPRQIASLSPAAKLLHSILLGRPYGLSEAELKQAEAQPDTTLRSLAAAARQVLLAEQAGSATSHSRDYLQEFLQHAQRPQKISGLPADLPALNNDDLAMLHVYAMVMSGQKDLCANLLADYLGSEQDFTHRFAAMALRAIGSQKAVAILQQRANEYPQERLLQEALYFPLPNLSEPAHFAYEVKPENRERTPMLAQAKRNDTQAILPTMLLGMLAADAPAEQLQQEREFLANLYQNADDALWRKYMYGYAALALRFQMPFADWQKMIEHEAHPQRRAFLIRALASQHPQRFLEDSVTLFAQEQDVWTREEYFAQYRALAKGKVLFSALDAIWMPPLEYRQAYPAQTEQPHERVSHALLRLWAKGRFPAQANQQQCPSCNPNWLAELVQPEDEINFLQGYLALKTRDADSFAPLNVINDARLLPVLQVLADRETDPAIQQAAQQAHDKLAERSARNSCCGSSQACLLQQASIAESQAKIAEEAVTSVNQAQHYLSTLNARAPQIEITDLLHAQVKLSDGQVQRWEVRQGCWRNQDSAPVPGQGQNLQMGKERPAGEGAVGNKDNKSGKQHDRKS